MSKDNTITIKTSDLPDKPPRKVRTPKPKTPEVDPKDITIEYVNGVLIVKHRIDSKIPKFTRIKSEVIDSEYKVSQYRISGV